MKIEEATERWTLKMSKDISFEEMRESLRAHLGRSDFDLSREVFEAFKAMDTIERAKRELMMTLLGPIFNEYADREDPEAVKRKKEINDILNYMQFAGDQTWKISEIRESPDFTLEVEGRTIGLEITGLYDSGFVAQISRQRVVCAKVEQLINSTTSDLSGMININFDLDKVKSLRNSDMISQLSSYLIQKLRQENVEMPEFISSVDIRSHQALQLSLSEHYVVKDIDKDVLDDLIAQKEAKINQYKANSGLDEIWLLVILDGVSQMSAPDFSPEMMPQRAFAFERVIVYDSFKQIAISSPPSSNLS